MLRSKLYDRFRLSIYSELLAPPPSSLLLFPPPSSLFLFSSLLPLLLPLSLLPPASDRHAPVALRPRFDRAAPRPGLHAERSGDPGAEAGPSSATGADDQSRHRRGNVDLARREPGRSDDRFRSARRPV